MRKQRSDGQETRQRLLIAASEIFSKKGFWETTNADICEKARANTAAVNYHFGSKENLYIQAWKYSFDKSIIAHPPDGGVNANAPAEEKLQGSILALMSRIADPQSHDFEIVHKEMANPTGLLTEIIEKSITPLDNDFQAIIRELLGNKASEQEVAFCYMSVKGQCFGPMLHLRRSRSTPAIPRPKDLALTCDIKKLAEHITQFSLIAIDGIRKKIEQAKKDTKKQ